MTGFAVFLLGCFAGGLLTYLFLRYDFNQKKKIFYRDTLTGLNNSYYFEKIIKKYTQVGTSFLLFDIDNFKDYNSKFGYDDTDKLLKLFVDKIKNKLPEGCEFIRYKFGDEFLIIDQSLPESLNKLISEIKDEINLEPFNINGSSVILEFSAGITSVLKNDTQQTIISRLTNALYKAKQNKNVSVIV